MSTPEGLVLRQIMDWLAAEHILAFRMPTGGARVPGGFMRFGVKGMADILAFRTRGVDDQGTWCSFSQAYWIETKAAKGRQSEYQKSFQAQVEREGHRYGICRSVEDVAALLATHQGVDACQRGEVGT
jgi:hypothetical protein